MAANSLYEAAARQLVSELWAKFCAAPDSANAAQDTFSDDLHGPFVIHFICDEPGILRTNCSRSNRSADNETEAGAEKFVLDADWALALAAALTHVLLVEEPAPGAAPADTRDVFMQLQFLAARRSETHFLSCSSVLDLAEGDEDTVEIWFRALLLCDFGRRLIEFRAGKGMRVVPWVATALALLRIDDAAHRMPAAYTDAAAALVATALRVCEQEVASHKQDQQQSPALRSLTPALLSIALKLVWHRHRAGCGGAASSSELRRCIALHFSARGVDADSPSESAWPHLLLLAAELGVARIASRYNSAASAAASSRGAPAPSRRGAAPAALQGRFLQHGDIVGALSNGVELATATSTGPNPGANDVDEDEDPAAARRAKAQLFDAAQQKEARLGKLRREEARFLSSSDDDDDEANGSGSGSAVERFHLHSSAVAWRKRQERLLQAEDTGATGAGDDAARVKAFLQQTLLGAAAMPTSGAAHDDPASQLCPLVDPLAAAGWIAAAMAEREPAAPPAGAADPAAIRMMLVLNVFSQAAQLLHSSFDAETISRGIVERLALAHVPLYSVSCERLPTAAVRRLGFLVSPSADPGGASGGGEGDEDEVLSNEASRLLSAGSNGGALSAGDKEKRDGLIRAMLDALREAAVARRSAVGESIAVALQSMAWLVSQPPPAMQMKVGATAAEAAASPDANAAAVASSSSSPPQQQQQQQPFNPLTYVHGMNALLQRCDEGTRFKIVTSLLVLSPHDSFSTTFLGALRFCINDDLQLCEKSAAAASAGGCGIARHDLRSPFLVGPLLLSALAVAVREWSSGLLRNFWFRMRMESCMTVLQLLGSLRGVDARLKRATFTGLFDWGSARATAANRRALQLAKEHIVDTVAHEIAAVVKAKQQQQQQQESDGGAAAASSSKKTTAISAALGGEITDLVLHQFEVFLPIATNSLASLSQ